MKFERAANYDKFALAQDAAAGELARALKDFACQNRAKGFKFESAYEIGCGSGLLTRRLTHDFKFETLTLNDLYEAPAMKDFPRQIGDIRALALPRELDLIASSSVFQWIEDLPALAARLAASLKPGGVLAFSAFCGRTLSELSDFTRQGLDYKSASEFREIFSRDFAIASFSHGRYIERFGSLRELLNSLKQTGVNNVRGDFTLTKSSLGAMDAHFGGRYALSYEYVVMICQKEKK